MYMTFVKINSYWKLFIDLLWEQVIVSQKSIRNVYISNANRILKSGAVFCRIIFVNTNKKLYHPNLHSLVRHNEI